jgi:hypothetical protein
MDRAHPDQSKQTTDCSTSLCLVSAPDLRCSPDLAPSDFYLFGKVKNLLTGKKFASADEICQILGTLAEMCECSFSQPGKEIANMHGDEQRVGGLSAFSKWHHFFDISAT